MAAAGLWTTAEDLAKFVIDVQLAVKEDKGKVLSQSMTNKMLTPFVSDHVGLGFFIEQKCIKQATFNPKVRNYWTVVCVLVSAVTIVGIVLTPLVAIVVWLVSRKILNAMSARLLERKLVVKRGITFVVEKSIPLKNYRYRTQSRPSHAFFWSLSIEL
jgi:uncharacterized membrane protein YdbT with pleckstrin-like domain